MHCLNKTAMIDNDEGLKDRKRILGELSSLLRFEEQLLQDGWYSESDFADEVKRLVLELAELLQQDE
ncbi:hypothetical protein IMSAGC001_04195 [Bacteroides acidifaciens]|uniref:Uncharacterized protein n=2 Tax=Bacteroidia TaxID=200643 RepID=A0A7J0A9B0_9BACE|nr:hypothetical protein [Bacteroides acidifaciens]GFH88750.1 hypothetical protein IMSAGC001_04195 [Bacteroides acidifaciens]